MSIVLLQNSANNFGSLHIRTARDNEYLAFSQVTQRLRNASRSDDRHEMIAAANACNQLWTAIAADLMHPENSLPPDIKAGILSLALFSIKRGRLSLLGEASADPLIEINFRIMKGLRGDLKS
ncbi:flagellar biosynthesis regulator FlaF [Paracoccus sp. PXZ]